MLFLIILPKMSSLWTRLTGEVRFLLRVVIGLLMRENFSNKICNPWVKKKSEKKNKSALFAGMF
jgi:hypothetical protein